MLMDNASPGRTGCINFTRLSAHSFRRMPLPAASCAIVCSTICIKAIPGRIGSPGKCPENQGESGGTSAVASILPLPDETTVFNKVH